MLGLVKHHDDDADDGGDLGFVVAGIRLCERSRCPL